MPVAIVTSSSRGIGRGVALRLASDGFAVVVNDIEAQKSDIYKVIAEIQAIGKKAHGIIADVTIKAQVESMVAETVKTFGELNVMVANAGILETTTILDMTVDQWDKVMAVNIRGVFLCHQAAAHQLIQQGKGGKLIAACSISGYRPSGKAPAYCTSKWAVRGLTQTCALELGQYGITVNAYCPGSCPTNMSLQFAARLSKEQNVADPC